jgi:hypothetical protein
LLEDVFKEDTKLVCSVETIDKFNDEVLVIPRRWKKSSFATDSLYMLLNFFEKRYYIKRAIEEGYHVILDRGTEMEWAIAPPELVNSYIGIWFEGILRRIASVGKRVNIAHILPPETAIERMEKRIESGETESQSYDDKRTLIRTGNQIKSYFRRKRKKKLPRKKKDYSHLHLPEDFAEEARRVREGRLEDQIGDIDASIYQDGQSEVIVDTSSQSKKFAAAAGLTMAGIAAAAPILKRIIEAVLDNQ